MATFGDLSANQYWGMAQNLPADAQQQQHVQMPQATAAPLFTAPANFAGGQHHPVAFAQQHPGAFEQQPQQWVQPDIYQPYVQQVQQPRHYHHHEMAMPVAMQPFDHRQHQQAWLQSVAPQLQQYQQHQQLYYSYGPYQGQPMGATITPNPHHHQYHMAHQMPAAVAPSFQHQAPAFRLGPDFFSPPVIPPEQDLISAVAATIPFAPPNPSEDAFWASAAAGLARRQGREVLVVPDSPPRPAPHQDDVVFVAEMPRASVAAQQQEPVVVPDSPPRAPITTDLGTVASSAGVTGGPHQDAGASQEPEPSPAAGATEAVPIDLTTAPAPKERVVNPRKVVGVGIDGRPCREYAWMKEAKEEAKKEAELKKNREAREKAQREVRERLKKKAEKRKEEEGKKAKAAERAEAKKRKRASDELVEEGSAAAGSARPKKARKSTKEQTSPTASEGTQLLSPPVSEKDDFDALTAAMEAEFMACADFEEVEHAPPPPQSAAAANALEAPLGAGQTLAAPSAEPPAAVLAPEQTSAPPSANTSEPLWAAEQSSAAAADNSLDGAEDDDYDELFDEKEPAPILTLSLPGTGCRKR
ncbi:hypothetical protein W97_08132 [Coniosporium apollinis CBS 100218]|uniref:Uncharacterized protein n=1 Tax=Coniosporium apollinis (strain CBS 100218) TaxID=1168221 RepID=R7Z4D1_CONA1|nr:uncharacterized protein W97_08132 [Coniosporium apollinis CBS 100218]EON68874.1 hypothetical protein W97_08132 [Coniosporium apollinis CBS 100218]